MAIYEFQSKKGEVISRHYPIGEAPGLGQKIRVGNTWYTRILSAEGVRTAPPGNWPHTTVMQGVHPSQAGELHDFLQKAGVPTDVKITGTMASMVWTDPTHRRKCCEALGWQDKNAGYSDPVSR